jgi:hypothetical protein
MVQGKKCEGSSFSNKVLSGKQRMSVGICVALLKLTATLLYTRNAKP